jgi:hypothetical protein
MRRETPAQALKKAQAEGKPLIEWGEYIAVEKHSGAVGGKVVEQVLKVTKLTPTQVVAGRDRFYRLDGRSVTPAFLSRGVARPATKKEFDAYTKKIADEKAKRDEERRKIDAVENSPENTLVRQILDDWDPDRRPRLRALGERQLLLIRDLMETKRSEACLDRLYAAHLTKDE